MRRSFALFPGGKCRCVCVKASGVFFYLNIWRHKVQLSIIGPTENRYSILVRRSIRACNWGQRWIHQIYKSKGYRSRSHLGQIITLKGILSPTSGMHVHILMKHHIYSIQGPDKMMAFWRSWVQRSKSQTTYLLEAYQPTVHRRPSVFFYVDHRHNDKQFWVLT